MTRDFYGAALIVVLAGSIAFIFRRYPDFRQGFRRYWSGPQIAKRMNMWSARPRRVPRTREEAITSIRKQLLASGVPTDHLTDEQIEERVIAIHRDVRDAGISIAEALARMQRVAMVGPRARDLLPAQDPDYPPGTMGATLDAAGREALRRSIPGQLEQAGIIDQETAARMRDADERLDGGEPA